MKRILIIFALLSAFILPLQTAQANSFFSLFDQITRITGVNAIDWFGQLPEFDEKFDIAVLYASRSGNDPFAGNGTNIKGFDVLQNVFSQDFFGVGPIGEVVSSGGSSAVYEYNGASIELSGGTIFVSTFMNNVNYIFALSPAGTFHTPAPAALLLLGSGVGGIVAMRRKLR